MLDSLGHFCFHRSVQCAFKMLQTKSLQGMSSLPFSSLLANSIVWTCYGLLRGDHTVIVPNGAGILAGAFCMWAYNTISKAGDESLTFGILALLSVTTGWAYIQKQADFLGSIGCLLSILLLGAPLATFGKVVREKSTTSMSFPISMASFLNSLSWTLYGLLIAHDPMVRSIHNLRCFLEANVTNIDTDFRSQCHRIRAHHIAIGIVRTLRNFYSRGG